MSMYIERDLCVCVCVWESVYVNCCGIELWRMVKWREHVISSWLHRDIYIFLYIFLLFKTSSMQRYTLLLLRERKLGWIVNCNLHFSDKQGCMSTMCLFSKLWLSEILLNKFVMSVVKSQFQWTHRQNFNQLICGFRCSTAVPASSR